LIGILGGAFNPIHRGHLAIAEQARLTCQLEQVIFMPTFRPPHKSDSDLISAEHRLKMVQLAIKGNPVFKCSELELDKQGVSYSIETMESLQTEQPKGVYALVIGGDSLVELHTWRAIEKILNNWKIIAISRPNYNFDLSELTRMLTNKKLIENISWHDSLRIDISSSQVRECCRLGLPIDDLVSRPVAEYIKEHRLYLEAKCT